MCYVTPLHIIILIVFMGVALEIGNTNSLGTERRRDVSGGCSVVCIGPCTGRGPDSMQR